MELNANELLTPAEVAELLKYQTRTIYRIQSAIPGRTRPTGAGGPLRFRRGDVEAWIAAGCPRGPRPVTQAEAR